MFATFGSAQVVLRAFGLVHPHRFDERLLCMQTSTKGVIALPPTTIEIVDLNSDIDDHLRDVEVGLMEQQEGHAIDHTTLFDDESPHATFASYARKYQPNSEIRTHTPPKLPIKLVQVSCSTTALAAAAGIRANIPAIALFTDDKRNGWAALFRALFFASCRKPEGVHRVHFLHVVATVAMHPQTNAAVLCFLPLRKLLTSAVGPPYDLSHQFLP